MGRESIERRTIGLMELNFFCGITAMRAIARFIWNDSAATSVEYAVMLALILIAVLAAIGTVGAKSGGMWGGVVSSLQSSGQ
jgi:pilus assembly protein Flp/PilA